MTGRKKVKAQIHAAKPEPPAFLQRMRAQIVANEDNERRERSEKRRREPPDGPVNPDDEPTIVELNDDDLTEAEYKRMKTALETQYKLDESKKTKAEELDIDLIMNINRQHSSSDGASSSKDINKSSRSNATETSTINRTPAKNRKLLSYGSSSSDEDD